MTHGNVHGRETIKSWWRDSRGERLRAWLWPTSLAASRNSSSDGAIDERFEAIASPLEKLSRTRPRSCGIVKYDAVAPSPCPLCPFVFPFMSWSRIVNTGQPGDHGFGSFDKSSSRNFFLVSILSTRRSLSYYYWQIFAIYVTLSRVERRVEKYVIYE